MFDLMRYVAILLSLFLGACASVTQTPNLDTDAARRWLYEAGDARLRVDGRGDVTATGHIATTTADVLRLRLADGRTIEIPIRDGVILRERRRWPGAVMGAFAGIGVGLVTGLILNSALAVSNPDSAGGKEHPPLAVPLGVLGGVLIGTTIGAVIGTERRLEVGANTR